MISLSETIRSMVLLFRRGDSRRRDIGLLADQVERLQHAARNHLAATRRCGVVQQDTTWTELKAALDAADDFKFPE